MTNVGLTGMPRHGKTLKLVDLTIKAHRSKYYIITPLKYLKLPKIPYDPNIILDAFERQISIQKAFGIPEGAYIWICADELTALGGFNRSSLSKLNIIINFLFMQAAKRRISIGWTAQIWKSVDKNERKLTSLNIDCVRFGTQWSPSMFLLKYTYKDRKLPPFYRRWEPVDFRPVMKYFDTEEPINPSFLKK